MRVAQMLVATIFVHLVSFLQLHRPGCLKANFLAWFEQDFLPTICPSYFQINSIGALKGATCLHDLDICVSFKTMLHLGNSQLCYITYIQKFITRNIVKHVARIRGAGMVINDTSNACNYCCFQL